MLFVLPVLAIAVSTSSSMSSIELIAIIVPCLLAAFGVLWGFYRAIYKWVIRPWQTLVGRTASPGSLEVPSLLDRVTTIVNEQKSQGEDLKAIHESVGSLAGVVNNLSIAVNTLSSHLAIGSPTSFSSNGSDSGLANSIRETEKTTNKIYRDAQDREPAQVQSSK